MIVSPASNRHVLIVDDDDDDIFFLSTMIGTHFPSVTLTAINQSTQAIPYLTSATQLPNLIFMDMNMPQLTGLELLRQLRQQAQFNRIPIIIWSVNLSPEVIEACYDAGVTSVIEKASSLNGMQQTIHDIFHYWFGLVHLP